MYILRRLPVSVRVTAAAVAVLALSLALGSALFQNTLRRTQIEQLDSTARLRLQGVVELIDDDKLPTRLTADRDSVLLVQVLDDRSRVLASTANVQDMHAMASVPVESHATNEMMTDPQNVNIDGVTCRLVYGYVATKAGTYRVLVASPFRSINEVGSTLRKEIRKMSPLVLLGAAVLLWAVVWLSLRPVRLLREGVDAISPMDLHRRLQVPPANDEIGKLATTMNSLLDRLQRSSDRQSRFVSDASHELRSPLASIRTRIEVGLRNENKTTWPDLARGVLADNVRLERLVRDLLEVARHDGARRPSKSELYLDDLVMMEVETSRLIGSISIDVSGVSGGRVLGNADQLRRVIANLLDNAQRFAASQIRVRVHPAGTPDEPIVVLAVADDGPGIPEEERERVFERFAKVGEDRARDHVRGEGGSGLGLAIVREIVVEHGGSVRIDQTGGPGTTVVVELPEC